MRCSCTICGTYMVHSEGVHLGCVCPECLARCTACLGTNSVISREAFQKMKNDPAAAEKLLWEPEPFEEKYTPDEFGRE